MLLTLLAIEFHLLYHIIYHTPILLAKDYIFVSWVPLLHRPRPLPLPPITLTPHTPNAHQSFTSQPPILTIPHWIALRKRHRPASLDTSCSSVPTATRTHSRKRLRQYTYPPPPINPPSSLQTTAHLGIPRHSPRYRTLTTPTTINRPPSCSHHQPVYSHHKLTLTIILLLLPHIPFIGPSNTILLLQQSERNDHDSNPPHLPLASFSLDGNAGNAFAFIHRPNLPRRLENENCHPFPHHQSYHPLALAKDPS